jgi:hypothetical protein
MGGCRADIAGHVGIYYKAGQWYHPHNFPEWVTHTSADSYVDASKPADTCFRSHFWNCHSRVKKNGISSFRTQALVPEIFFETWSQTDIAFDTAAYWSGFLAFNPFHRTPFFF